MSARALALSLVLVLGCGGDDAPLAPEGAPNLLLVSIDTLRADHVGAWGADFAETPTLDALATRGVRFETAIATAPLTLPSHASLLTGLWPPRHGVRHNGLYRLGKQHPTLAGLLAAAGWETGAVVGAFVLDARFGLARGFAHYDDATGAELSAPGGFLERDARAVTDAALAWLGEAREPFFLFAHYYDPHRDFEPPEPFASRFAGRPYDGEIAYVDAELGRLLGALEGDGRLARTLVVVTSDHGESLGEHGEPTHAYSLYDATQHVPLLVSGPGIPSGGVVAGVVRAGVDVAPTLLELAGVAPPESLDGRSLVPLWSAGETAPRHAYAETLATQLDFGWAPLFALRSERYLFVDAPRPELYDVGADPGQTRNLLAGAPDAHAETRASLEAELAAIAARDRDAPAAGSDPETLARLRALGYAVRAVPHREGALDPKDGLAVLPNVTAASTALARGDAAAALRHAEAVLARAPESATAHGLRGRALLLAGDARGALLAAERAKALLPQASAWHVLLGDVHVQLGELEAAVAAYRAALQQDPDDAEAHAGLVWQAELGSPMREAERHAARALERMPESAALHERLAATFERLGEYERALALTERALELDPHFERLHMRAAIQYARLGREAESARHLARAGAARSDPALANRLGIVHAARGEHARAARTFEALLAVHPDYAPARTNLARVLRESGQGAAAPVPEATPPAAPLR